RARGEPPRRADARRPLPPLPRAPGRVAAARGGAFRRGRRSSRDRGLHRRDDGPLRDRRAREAAVVSRGPVGAKRIEGPEMAGTEPVHVVLVTAPDLDAGARIGRRLVEEGLAACANLVPGVRSIYRWQGEIQDDAEVLLIVKTRASLLDALAARVRA